MSILVFVLDLLINSLVVLDTLGLVVASKKSNVNTYELWRICLTWVCFAVLNCCMCCSCGFIGTLLSFVGIAGKFYIGLPKLGGADKVNQMLATGQITHYVRALVDIVKSKVGGAEAPHEHAN
jgi:hypothetical protein